MAELIDREALMDNLYELVIHGTMAVKTVLPIIGERIQSAPTIEAEPVRHGKWLFNSIEKPEYRICNQCGAAFRIEQQEWKRCPVCEAKMDGEVDEL